MQLLSSFRIYKYFNFLSKIATFLFILIPCGLFAGEASSSGVSKTAYTLVDFFSLPITNSILTTWIVSILFIIFIRVSIGKPQLVPNKAQAVTENLIEGLKGLLKPIMGQKAFKLAFPMLLAFFVFILIHNWSGLIPGIGVFGHYDADGNFKYWLRPASSDLNGTLGLALVAMLAWAYISIKVSGIKFFIWELFGNKAKKEETPKPIYLMLTPIFLMVGFIEVVSIIFRPLSLSFRLYGNVFGGESLLSNLSNNILPYLIPMPFYFYELLVGVVQAMIFTLLVAIYIGLITNHGEESTH